MRDSLNDVATELRCPTTQELPFDPVMAEDGRIYERKAILQWFSSKRNPTSPSTGARMGLILLPAIQTKNTIETLVKSGAIEGELAEAWCRKLADETKVKKLRAKAKAGDGGAMYDLGLQYEFGKSGLVKDATLTRGWFERSAAARDPSGMACFGQCLLHGTGGSVERSLGLVLVTEAAYLGSNVGAMKLARGFAGGFWGLRQDHGRARFWLKKIVDGEFEFDYLSERAKAEAAEMLQKLE